MVAIALWATSRVTLGGLAMLSFTLEGQPTHWCKMWLQWDVGYYLTIATRGYVLPVASSGFESGQSDLPFFPLLPIGIALVHLLRLSIVASGLLVATTCSLVAGILLHRMSSERFGRETADWAVASLFVLPGSFVLSAPLTEAPFLLLSIAGAFLAYRRATGPASVAAGLLTITRLTGILFGAGLALDWLIERLRGRPRAMRELFFFSLIPIPILVFLTYMLNITGDAFAPIHSETFWHQHLGAPFQNLFLIAWSSDPRLQLHSGVALTLIIVLLLSAKLFTPGEWLFVVASVAASSSTYAASNSLIRYMIGLYPIHIAFGHLASRSIYGRGLLIGFAMVDAFLMVAWAHGSDVFF